MGKHAEAIGSRRRNWCKFWQKPNNGKVTEAGRLSFACGLLALLFGLR